MLTVGSAQRMDTLLAYIQRAQSDIQTTEYQIANGKKGPSFSDYERPAAVVTFSTTIAAREMFMTNAKSAETKLTLADKVLEQLGDIARDAERFAHHNSYSTEEAADLRNSALGWLQTAVSDLNMPGADGYLFGGLDADTPPVAYAADLTDPSWTSLTGDPNDLLTFDPSAQGYFWFLNQDVIGTASDALAFDYDGSFPTTLSPHDAYQNHYYQGGALRDADGNIDEGLRTRIDRNQTVETGFSAAESGLEKLLFGLHMIALTPLPDAEPAVGDPTTEQQEAFYLKNIERARMVIADAVDEITGTHIRAASHQIIVENSITRHIETQALEKDLLGNLIDVDPAEAITRYQLLERNLQATYEITSRVSEMALTNYI